MATEIGNDAIVYGQRGEAKDDLPEFASRVRKKLAASLLSDLHPEPVRTLTKGTLFGAWLRSLQAKTHLTKKDLAAALGTVPEVIEQMRSDEFLPWTMPPSQMAETLFLFRLHIDGLNELATSSLHRNQNQTIDSMPSPSDTSAVPTWLAEVRDELSRRERDDLLS